MNIWVEQILIVVHQQINMALVDQVGQWENGNLIIPTIFLHILCLAVKEHRTYKLLELGQISIQLELNRKFKSPTFSQSQIGESSSQKKLEKNKRILLKETNLKT